MVEAIAGGVPIEPLARYFEYWVLRLQGVYPEARDTLSEGARAFLSVARSVSPRDAGALPVEARVLRELESVHRTLISMHLEKTLKSDRVLRDLHRHN